MPQFRVLMRLDLAIVILCCRVSFQSYPWPLTGSSDMSQPLPDTFSCVWRQTITCIKRELTILKAPVCLLYPGMVNEKLVVALDVRISNVG